MATTTKSGEKPVKAKPAAPAASKVAAPAKPAAAKAAAKPAAAKPVAKPAPAKVPAASAAKPVAPTPKKEAAPKKAAAAAKPELTPLAPDQRRFYVEVAAYYIAERRGFHGESQLNDWVEAENEIDRLLSEGVLNP